MAVNNKTKDSFNESDFKNSSPDKKVDDDENDDYENDDFESSFNNTGTGKSDLSKKLQNAADNLNENSKTKNMTEEVKNIETDKFKDEDKNKTLDAKKKVII